MSGWWIWPLIVGGAVNSYLLIRSAIRDFRGAPR